jgi:hypothetical protein
MKNIFTQKGDKTNWFYLAVVCVSALVTGLWLVSYINSSPAEVEAYADYPWEAR